MLVQSVDRLNTINIGLMLISLLAAFVLPFEVFLFSYAVLGPAHYLTEIPWLYRKNFFTQKKWDIWIIGILSVLIAAGAFSGFLTGIQISRSIAFTFITAGILTWVDQLLKRIVGIVIGAVIACFAFTDQSMSVYFGILLPTMIHVFVFTGLFIVYGSLKSKSLSGALSVVFYVCCGVLSMVLPPIGAYLPSEGVLANLQSFSSTHEALAIFLNTLDPSVDENIFFGSTGWKLMRLVAFSYTYHYLNWFSKTSIIGWHHLPRYGWVALSVSCVGAVALYAIDYQLGLQVLFMLSFLHVFLELPLNFHSISGIGKIIQAKYSRRTTP